MENRFLVTGKKNSIPIVPVFIGSKNSALFYGLSTIYKPLGTMMLVNEMFNQKGGEILFRIGKPNPSLPCINPRKPLPN